MDLFDLKDKVEKRKQAPLAELMRPETIDDFIGQDELVGPGSPLRTLLELDAIPSVPCIAGRRGVRMFMHPARSVSEAPTSIGSKFAEAW